MIKPQLAHKASAEREGEKVSEVENEEMEKNFKLI